MSGRRLAPSSIRFAQKDIGRCFTHGDAVHDIIDDILTGRRPANEFWPIRVAKHNGQWYAENNRSLYVFRVLEYEGNVSEIPVREVRENTIWRLLTTENEGTSVTMRGGEYVRPHSIEEIQSHRSSWGMGTAVAIGAVVGGLLHFLSSSSSH